MGKKNKDSINKTEHSLRLRTWKVENPNYYGFELDMGTWSAIFTNRTRPIKPSVYTTVPAKPNCKHALWNFLC